MTGFLRALRGELYAGLHRRQVRIALALVVLGVAVRVLLAYLQPVVLGTSGADEVQASAYQNFWPRFAQGARFGLILAELATVVVLGGLLPREIGLGAVRDPLVRRISRPAFLLARAVIAVMLPLALAAGACLSSAVVAALLFDAGHVVTERFVLDDDPGRREAFREWCARTEVRPDQLAAWEKLQLDEDLEPDAAARRLGLPEFELPEELYSFVPVLQFYEGVIRAEILDGLLHGLLPLMALGLFALALSVLLPTGVLAAGIGFGAVLLFGVFLAPELDDDAWWIFADWLPGMGHESQLELARLVADGYGEPMTAGDARRAGLLGSVIQGGGFLILSLVLFPRRRL